MLSTSFAKQNHPYLIYAFFTSTIYSYIPYIYIPYIYIYIYCFDDFVCLVIKHCIHLIMSLIIQNA